MVRAIEGKTHPLRQLLSAEQTIGLRDTALAVHPLGFYRVQPRALSRQVATYDPHALLLLVALLHLPVVLLYPPPDLLAHVPAGVVPHQHQLTFLPTAASSSEHHERNRVVIPLTGRPSTKRSHVSLNSGMNSP